LTNFLKLIHVGVESLRRQTHPVLDRHTKQRIDIQMPPCTCSRLTRKTTLFKSSEQRHFRVFTRSQFEISLTGITALTTSANTGPPVISFGRTSWTAGELS
jgi:hypothetical protein